MKTGLVSLSISFVIASMALACANAANNNPGGFGGNADGGDAGNTSSTESEDDPPHALGMISLAETHASGASTSTPSVGAAFIPDSTTVAAKACGKEIDGCTIVAKPDCGGADAGSYSSGCASNEVCVLDENCDSVCQPVPSCTTTCDADQECKLVGTKSKCVPKVEFNAGVLTLSGDGMSKTMTLRPPYTKAATDGDSPYVPEGTINVTATGASDVGYEKFTDSFKATMFMEPKPTLSKQLDQATVFDSTDPITIAWKPGADEVQITVTGNKGSAVCKADDASGTFDITRKVWKQIYQDDSSSYSTPSVSFAVARVRTEVKKDKKTMGKITGTDLPPVGFVRYVTQSTETYTAQGCPSGQKLCPSSYSGGTPACTSVLSDTYNCGQCGKVCPSGKYCSSGVCY